MRGIFDGYMVFLVEFLSIGEVEMIYLKLCINWVFYCVFWIFEDLVYWLGNGVMRDFFEFYWNVCFYSFF